MALRDFASSVDPGRLPAQIYLGPAQSNQVSHPQSGPNNAFQPTTCSWAHRRASVPARPLHLGQNPCGFVDKVGVAVQHIVARQFVGLIGDHAQILER